MDLNPKIKCVICLQFVPRTNYLVFPKFGHLGMSFYFKDLFNYVALFYTCYFYNYTTFLFAFAFFVLFRYVNRIPPQKIISSPPQFFFHRSYKLSGILRTLWISLVSICFILSTIIWKIQTLKKTETYECFYHNQYRWYYLYNLDFIAFI